MRYRLVILINCLLACYSCRPIGPDKRAIELNNRAAQMFQKGKSDSALILLDMAIQIDSNYFIAYSNKCTFLWQLNRNEEALRTAKQAIQIREVTGSVYFLEGLGYERVGHLDSARSSYLKAIDYSEQLKSKNLLFAQKTALAELVTVTKGKGHGLKKLQELFDMELDTLPRSNLNLVKDLKNEIESYQEGGLLEFLDSQFRQYCLTTDKSMDEVEEDFLNKGINLQGIIGKGDGYYLRVKNKFRPKVLALGLTECDD
jgi:tetratricopeptide (TPR) repeat protein